MNREKLALFAANAQAVNKGFTWQGSHIKRLAALLYALEYKPMDCDAVRKCLNLIKSNTGVFSTFRGNMSLCVAAMLSLKGDREELFENTVSVYELMKNENFRASDYLTVAAYQIAANVPKEQYHLAVANAKAYYDGMKMQHWFHTGQDDYIYAAMLGISGTDAVLGTERIEQLYQSLKPKLRLGNSVQALSQILVLGGKSEDMVRRVLSLRDILKAERIRLDKTYTLPALGVLALLPVSGDTVALDIKHAKEFLRKQKGFGAVSVMSQELLLYAAAIIASDYTENMLYNITTASVSTSIASIIIAQQAAIIAAASSSGAAAAAASS